MKSCVVKTASDLLSLAADIGKEAFPLTVSWAAGEKRSLPQNRTIHMWYGEAARQLGDTTSEDVRAQCKLHFGVPILRRDNAAFLLDYDKDIRPLPYEMKLKVFKALDPAITSRMKKPQLVEYMNAMQQHFAERGIRLTDPELRKYEAMQ